MTGGEARRRRLGLALAVLGALAIAAAGALAVLGGSVSKQRRQTTSSTQASATSTSTTISTSSSSTTTTTTTTSPPLTAPAPARPAPSTEQFGASVNLLFNSTGYTPRQVAAQLQALHSAGATIARSDALWEASEPGPPVGATHTYTWTFDDRIAGDLAAHHLRWLPILGYSAPWAQSIVGQDHSPPRSSADYAAYAGALALRYGRGGSFWREHPGLPAEPVDTYEIWNEPDSPAFWTPAPDPARYSDLYLAARAAIDAVQPAARVLVGGLTQPTSFLPAMLAARPQLRGHVDGVAIHPYAGAPPAVLDKIRTSRATLALLGMGTVPLYVTELGWSTSPPGTIHYLAPALRPGYIDFTFAALGHLNCGVAAAILYTWFSPEHNPADSEQWFGVDSPTGAPTADRAGFAHGLRIARQRSPRLALCG